jgi:antitoxin ParD1/3/4
MKRKHSLSSTDELRALVDRSFGGGTPSSSPSEFVRDVLRDRKERQEAAEIRDAILAGYQDALNGRTVTFRGNLRQLLNTVE